MVDVLGDATVGITEKLVKKMHSSSAKTAGMGRVQGRDKELKAESAQIAEDNRERRTNTLNAGAS